METERGGAKRRARRIWMGALLGAVALGLVLFYLPFEHPDAARGAVELVHGWRYATDRHPQPVTVERLNFYIALSPDEELVMTRRMTERADNPALLVRLSYLRARIELNGQILFDNRGDPPGENKGRSMHLVMLPGDYLGQELRYTVSSPYALFAASPENLWFGDVAALAAHAVGMSARNMLLTLMLVISGVLLLGASGMMSLGRSARMDVPWEGILFGLFCVLYGLDLMEYSAPFLWAFPPYVGARLVFVLWFLFPVPLMWFLGLKCRAWHRTLAFALAAAYSLAALGTVCSGLAGGVAFPDTLVFMNPALITAALGTMVLCALEWVKHNAFFRMTAPAFLLLTGSSLLSAIDIVAFYDVKELLRMAGLVLLVALVWADFLRMYRERRQSEMERRQLMSLKEHLAAAQFAAAEAHNRETRLLRHEIRHHLAALTVLMQEGKIAEIGEYLEKLDLLEQGLEARCYCAHSLVNAILCNADSMCQSDGVAFRCVADVPEALDIPDADLSTLLPNMLENAVDAARQVTGDGKWVEVQVRLKGNFLVIVCRNAHRGEVRRDGERFISTKKDARFHGYGILAMQQIVEKHESRLNIDYDDTVFSVKTILRVGGEGQGAPISSGYTR